MTPSTNQKNKEKPGRKQHWTHEGMRQNIKHNSTNLEIVLVAAVLARETRVKSACG